MKNTDLRIHGGTLYCSMSILTARLEEAVEQGEIVYIQKLLVDALNMHCIPGNSFPNLKFSPFAQITMSGRIQDRVKLSACI